MKFTVNRKQLEEEFAFISAVLTNGLGIASAVTLTVHPGDRLEMRAHNHKAALSTVLPCSATEPGQLTVQSYVFGQLVRLHPDPEFAAEVVNRRLRVNWSTGSALLSASAARSNPVPAHTAGRLF